MTFHNTVVNFSICYCSFNLFNLQYQLMDIEQKLFKFAVFSHWFNTYREVAWTTHTSFLGYAMQKYFLLFYKHWIETKTSQNWGRSFAYLQNKQTKTNQPTTLNPLTYHTINAKFKLAKKSESENLLAFLVDVVFSLLSVQSKTKHNKGSLPKWCQNNKKYCL